MNKIESITKIKSITIDFVKRLYLSAFLFLCCTLRESYANSNTPNMKLYHDKYNLVNTPYIYEVNSNKNAFTIWCNADYHTIFGYPKGYPRYNSTDGLKTRP